MLSSCIHTRQPLVLPSMHHLNTRLPPPVLGDRIIQQHLMLGQTCYYKTLPGFAIAYSGCSPRTAPARHLALASPPYCLPLARVGDLILGNHCKSAAPWTGLDHVIGWLSPGRIGFVSGRSYFPAACLTSLHSANMIMHNPLSS